MDNNPHDFVDVNGGRLMHCTARSVWSVPLIDTSCGEAWVHSLAEVALAGNGAGCWYTIVPHRGVRVVSGKP